MFHKLMMRALASGGALNAATYLVPGLHLEGWKSILVVCVVFGVVNALIKPLLSLITCLLQAMTLGMFTIAINVGLLYAMEEFVQEVLETKSTTADVAFVIDNVHSALLGAFIISVVSFFLSRILR